MSCDHFYSFGPIAGRLKCASCKRSALEEIIDLRARLDAAEKRAGEAEAVANEAMRVGRLALRWLDLYWVMMEISLSNAHEERELEELMLLFGMKHDGMDLSRLRRSYLG